MACSFHHSSRTSFQPSICSTKILRDNDPGQIPSALDAACDRCPGEETPRCVRYCVYDARELT